MAGTFWPRITRRWVCWITRSIRSRWWAQRFGQDLADGVLPLRGLLQCPSAVTQGPASDLQEIPIMLFALLAPTVSDVQTTFFGTSEMIPQKR